MTQEIVFQIFPKLKSCFVRIPATTLAITTLAITTFAIAGLVSSMAFSQQQPDPSVPPLPNNHIYANTVVLARFAPNAQVQEVANAPELVRRIQQQLQWIKSLAINQPAYIAIDIPFSHTATWNRVIVADQGTATMEAIQKETRDPQTSVFKDKGFVALSPNHDRPLSKHPLTASPSEREELMESLGRVASYPIQIGIALPEYARRTARELLPKLPSSVGGGETSQWVDGIRSVAIGMNPQNWTIEFSVLCDSEKTARSINLKSSGMLPSLPETDSQPSPTLLDLLGSALPKSHSNLSNLLRFVSSDGMPSITGKTIAWKHQTGSEGQRQQVIGTAMALLLGQSHWLDLSNQIKQIGLACHNFESANKMLPPGKATRDENGKPLLSWRVHILPFLGEAKLYGQFRLNEAWDSPHNKELIPKMPRVYMSSAHMSNSLPDGHTTLLAPMGKDTILGDTKSSVFSNISDGSSNTIWVVEAKPEFAVPWTSPRDYAFDMQEPNKGLMNVGEDQFLCGMADGSVLRLSLNMSASNLVNLFLKSDGHVVEMK